MSFDGILSSAANEFPPLARSLTSLFWKKPPPNDVITKDFFFHFFF